MINRNLVEINVVNLLSMIVLVLALLFIVTDATGASEARALFERKCSLCHSIERPQSKKKTKGEWKTTVMRMKHVNRCPLKDEEAEIIINYLSENFSK